MRAWWIGITYLGDSSVLLPCAAILAVWMRLSLGKGPAARWLLALAAVGALVAASKLAFMAWGLGIPSLDFIGFSGHSAMAALVWPVLLSLALGRQARPWRLAGALMGFALALAVALSRLALQAHSVAEIVTGFLVGTISALVFLGGFTVSSGAQLKSLSLVLPILMVAPFVYGHRFPSEQLLRWVAQRIHLDGTTHTRRDLHGYREDAEVGAAASVANDAPPK